MVAEDVLANAIKEHRYLSLGRVHSILLQIHQLVGERQDLLDGEPSHLRHELDNLGEVANAVHEKADLLLLDVLGVVLFQELSHALALLLEVLNHCQLGVGWSPGRLRLALVGSRRRAVAVGCVGDATVLWAGVTMVDHCGQQGRLFFSILHFHFSKFEFIN